MTTLKKLRESVTWIDRTPEKINKYKINPDHNTRSEMDAANKKYPLPSGQTYHDILAKQDNEESERRKKYDKKMQDAIDADKSKNNK